MDIVDTVDICQGWIFFEGIFFVGVNMFHISFVCLSSSSSYFIPSGVKLWQVGNFFFSKSLYDNISRLVLEKTMMIEYFRGLLDMTNILPFLQRFPFMSFLRNFTIYQYSQNIFSGKFWECENHLYQKFLQFFRIFFLNCLMTIFMLSSVTQIMVLVNKVNTMLILLICSQMETW